MKGKSITYTKKRLIEINDSDIEDLKKGIVVADIFDGKIFGVIYNPEKLIDSKTTALKYQ